MFSSFWSECRKSICSQLDIKRSTCEKSDLSPYVGSSTTCSTKRARDGSMRTSRTITRPTSAYVKNWECGAKGGFWSSFPLWIIQMARHFMRTLGSMLFKKGNGIDGRHSTIDAWEAPQHKTCPLMQKLVICITIMVVCLKNIANTPTFQRQFYRSGVAVFEKCKARWGWRKAPYPSGFISLEVKLI